MKRILSMALVAALTLGAAAQAFAADVSALEVKAKGSWRFSMNFANNFDFRDTKDGGSKEDDYMVFQRLRTTFRFVYNENVMGEIQTELGDTFWGDAASGGELDTRQRVFELKRGYIQFKLPETKILTSVGLQGTALPNAGYFGSMILDDDAGSLMVSAPINDMVSALVGYTRLNYNRSAQQMSNEFDAIFGALPVKLDGFNITPFFTVAWLGSDINTTTGATASLAGTSGDYTPQITYLKAAGVLSKDTNPWWVGMAFKMDYFDPFVVYADFNYGMISDLGAKTATGHDIDMSGWLMDLAVQYKGFKEVTPELFGSYSSGMDADDYNNDGDIGVMPFIRPTYGVPGTMLNGSMFTEDLGSPMPGFWMIGAAARNISFIDKLSHELIFIYGQGTNDDNVGSNAALQGLLNAMQGNPLQNGTYFGHPLGLLTDKDSYYEIDFNHKYQLYESLALLVEMGWGKIDLHDNNRFGTSTRNTTNTVRYGEDSMMKGVVGIKYDF